ncbi:MAG: diaminopropionate ammonia-lyase [Solirubrobacteraceae bacterium]
MAPAPPARTLEALVVAPRSAGDVRASPPGDAPRRFHATMPGYAPTPLRGAPTTAKQLGVAEVLVKDESSRLGLPSFKVLGAAWAVHRALLERMGLGPDEVPSFDALASRVRHLPPMTLSAATDGNHGRAVAHMAALLDLEARIYVPAGTARARIDAIASEGASVEVVDGGYDDAVRRSAADAGERCLVISDTSWPGYEDVPRWVIEGYATIFSEIDDQLAERGLGRVDMVAVPIGVGALAAATAAHFWARDGRRPVLVGVEPTSAACVLESVRWGSIATLEHEQHSMMAGLNCATPSLIAWPVVSRGIDVYMAVGDQRVPTAMRLLADDGIVAGETGAAGLAGMLRLQEAADAGQLPAELRPRSNTRVLLLCTEGATDPEAYRQLTGSSPEKAAAARPRDYSP